MGCQWGMLVILAKRGSPEKVGILALALAISAPVFMLSNLQLRVIQATDITEEFSFADYMVLRLLSTLLSLAVIVAVSIFSHYSIETALVVSLIGLAKAFESVSDVIYGLVQRQERMDLISRSMILKGVASIAAFGGIFVLTGSLIGAAAGLACAWCVVLGTYDFALTRVFGWKTPKLESVRISPLRCFENLFRLLKISLPLGLTMMLISLNTNIPRYFIEHYSGTRALGFFAAIAYLMVAGNLVINALAQAALPRLAVYYCELRLRDFRSLLLRLTGLAWVVGAVGVLVAQLAGKQVLSIMYRADYAGYSGVFTCLMAAAGAAFLASIMGCGMTAARVFSPQLPLNVLVAGVCALASWFWIPAHGLQGAAWALLAAGGVQFLASLLVLLRALRSAQRPIIVEVLDVHA
jgi:O-antigen/teichoic acid export membrane protein